MLVIDSLESRNHGSCGLNLMALIGGLFKDLECELRTLEIAMQTFMAILDEIAKIEDIVNRNEDLVSIVAVLQDVTQKMLGFRCEN